jgi:hypothetical protein
LSTLEFIRQINALLGVKYFFESLINPDLDRVQKLGVMVETLHSLEILDLTVPHVGGVNQEVDDVEDVALFVKYCRSTLH